MGEIKDFPCTYDHSAGIRKEAVEGTGLKFPDAYLHCDTMVDLAKALKEYDGAYFCELPFCHTIEAEAMGGVINYGNELAGPRAGEYIYQSMEEILHLPDIDFTQGRIHEVLLACRKLRSMGEQVVLNISGPLTILNVLIDARMVFKAMRKDRELVKRACNKIGEQLLNYIKEAKECGVQMISYADSLGSVKILGPKLAEQMVEDFTYNFLKNAEVLADENLLILLCPKTTFSLLGTEKAELKNILLGSPMEYGKACMESIGKMKFAGQMCIKNIHYMLKNSAIKEVKLK